MCASISANANFLFNIKFSPSYGSGFLTDSNSSSRMDLKISWFSISVHITNATGTYDFYS